MIFNIFMVILVASFILFIASRYILKVIKERNFNNREMPLLDKWEHEEFLAVEPQLIEKKHKENLNKPKDNKRII